MEQGAQMEVLAFLRRCAEKFSKKKVTEIKL